MAGHTAKAVVLTVACSTVLGVASVCPVVAGDTLRWTILWINHRSRAVGRALKGGGREGRIVVAVELWVAISISYAGGVGAEASGSAAVVVALRTKAR